MLTGEKEIQEPATPNSSTHKEIPHRWDYSCIHLPGGNFISLKLLRGGGMPSPSTRMWYFLRTRSCRASDIPRIYRGAFQLVREYKEITVGSEDTRMRPLTLKWERQKSNTSKKQWCLDLAFLSQVLPKGNLNAFFPPFLDLPMKVQKNLTTCLCY